MNRNKTQEFAAPLPVLGLITDHLERQAKSRGGQDFLVLGDMRLTYSQTRDLVDRVAQALLASGISRGDRVALLSGPRPEFFVHFLATTSIGAIWLGLNPKYTDGELDHVVGDAEPTMLFGFADVMGEGQTHKLGGLMARHPSLRQLVVMDEVAPAKGTSWQDFLGRADAVTLEDLSARRAEVEPMDGAYLVYTSGSTGRPKGALLTHRGSNLCNVIAVHRKGLSDRRLICNFPINHIGAIGDICGRTMTGGGTIFFQEKFSPQDMMSLIDQEQLNTMVGVPTMLQMCVGHPDFDTFDLTSVDLIGWGGAAMPIDVLQTLMRKTGCERCTMGYGMTETTGGVTYSGLTDSLELLSTTVGTPDDRQPLRLWHANGREAGVSESGEPEAGEIQVKGDYLLAQYWRLPEATAEAFTDDGWFHTGDLAIRRPDGHIQIVGRMSEMFKSGGYNVYPREVELALEDHPAVAMAAVVSLPDPTFQEIGIAYVMLGSGAEKMEGKVSAERLRAYSRERLANYKVPKQIVILDQLPMLPIGKVDKKALKARGRP